LAMARANKMIEMLEELGIPKDAMTPKAEFTDRTTVMQVCQFNTAFECILFNYATRKITLKKDFEWEKRLYSRDQQDFPDAQFQEPEAGKKVLQEVAKIALFYGDDLDVVVHKTYTTSFNDEHKQWLDELLWNRAEKGKEELVDLGIENEKVESRVEDVEEEAESFGMHFELKLNREETKVSPKWPDHIIEVVGAGVYEFNGRYKPAGMTNGETKYRHLGGGKETIALGQDGIWYMCINHDYKQGVYKTRDIDNGEPWKHVNTGATGLCPVVSFIEIPDGAPTPKSSIVNSVSFR